MTDNHELYLRVSALALGAQSALRAPDAASRAGGAEFDELLLLTQAVFDGHVPRANPPAPDLSFLAVAAQGGSDTRGRIVIALGASYNAAQPSALLGAARGQLVLRYVQDPATTADLGVTIEVYAEDAARTIGRVRVGVDLPGRSPFDMSGSTVVLQTDGEQWQSETDEMGGVDFLAVPLSSLPSLRVEIIPPADEPA